MYINPFWAGVAATILAEVAALFVYAIIKKRRNERRVKELREKANKSWREFLEERKK